MSLLTSLRPKNFPWFDYTRYTFSLGLHSSGTTWLSGHSASEYDADAGHIVVKGDMERQTRTAYAKIAAILDEGGLGLTDAQRVVEYVTVKGLEDYDALRGVREELIGRWGPAVCTVVVNRLLRPQALVEIEVTAGRDARYATTGIFDTGQIVYLSSVTAAGPEGMRFEGDLVGQANVVFDRAAEILARAHLDMSHVVKTVDYTTPETLANYRDTAIARKRFLGPIYPAAAGILLSKLQHPGALISLDVIATHDLPEAVNPGWSRYAKLTYSPAVKAAGLLFMSGQAALDPLTEKALFPGDVVTQAEYTYSNVMEVLRAAGGGPENLVKTIEYITPPGLPEYKNVADVRERMFREPYPASTGVIVDGLLRPEFLFEVDPLAIL